MGDKVPLVGFGVKPRIELLPAKLVSFYAGGQKKTQFFGRLGQDELSFTHLAHLPAHRITSIVPGVKKKK
jgi:hypothetical protein